MGKYKMAIFGWSKASFWNGNGAERIAITTIFIRSPKQIKFQSRITLMFYLLFNKAEVKNKWSGKP
jgi:hypothetical protein